MSESTFTVTDAQLYEQLAEGSATDAQGVHQLWLDFTMRVLTEDGPRPAQQATWYLSTGQWVPASEGPVPLCGEALCVREDHLGIGPGAHATALQTRRRAALAQAQATHEEELLALVQRNSTSLADLYRRGKQRGLLTAATAYH